jgi:hypothetical protein
MRSARGCGPNRGVARAKATAGPRTVGGRPGGARSSTVPGARTLLPPSARCNTWPGMVGDVRPPANVSWRAVCANGRRLRRGRRGRSSGQSWNLRSCVRRWPSFTPPGTSRWWGTLRPLSNRFFRTSRRVPMPGMMPVAVGGGVGPRDGAPPGRRGPPRDASGRQRCPGASVPPCDRAGCQARGDGGGSGR